MSIERIEEELANQAQDDLMVIGALTVKFAGVERLVQYPGFRPENDSEHSFHLALSATYLASTYYPELDTGLVSQFCLVHDLPEIYAGDTPSYRMTPEEQETKELAEKAAMHRLLGELPTYLAELLERYEEQKEPEARFVRLVDKLMPAVIHANASEENREVFLNTYNITSLAELEITSRERTEQIREMFPDFDFVHIVRLLTSSISRRRFFPEPTT